MIEVLVNNVEKNWKLFTFFLLSIITILSLYPLPVLPEVPGSDKSHHLIAYSVLAIPMVLANPRNLLLYLFLLIIYGGLIEIIQPYVNRYGEWLDFLANIIGVISTYIVVSIYRFYRQSNFIN